MKTSGRSEAEAGARPATAAPATTNTFTLASLDSKPVEASRPASAAAPALVGTVRAPGQGRRNGNHVIRWRARAAAPAATDRMRLASLPPNPSPTSAAPAAKPSAPDTTASTVTWPVRGADNDRVPSDLALAYATPLAPGTATAMRPEPMRGRSRPRPMTT